jgi:hypothetical protein
MSSSGDRRELRKSRARLKMGYREEEEWPISTRS